jgi:branched-chain amino acid transport system substrate-binding protein
MDGSTDVSSATRGRLAALLLAVALLAAACAPTAAPATGTAPAPKEPIKIGSILSTTGPPAYLGDKMKKGVELAIEEVNAAGGVNGRPLELTFYDPAGDSATAVNQTRRLLSQDGVDVVVGGGSASGIALAMAPITEESGVLFMSTEGARQIVEPVDQRRLTFKSTLNDTDVVGRTIAYWKKHNITTVAFLPDTSGFGQSANDVMKELAPMHGITVHTETFDPGTQDMTPQLTRLAAQNPQAYLAWTATPAGVVFLKNADQLGLKARAGIQHGFGFVDDRFMKQAEAAAVGSLLSSQKVPVYDQIPDQDQAKTRIAQFADAFKAKFNEAPNIYAGQTYDGVYLVAEAMRRANSTKGDVVAKELEKITGFVGATGVFNFSDSRHAGLSEKDVVIIRWNGERFELADYE